MANELQAIPTGVRVVITDIEGTTTSISFVRDTLFPYARPRLGSWLRAHAEEEAAQAVQAQVQHETGQALTQEQVIRQLEDWSDADRKVTPLKTLQGLIWAAGYADGSLIAPLYPDVAPALSHWRTAGLTLGVYSSGSVAAQQLLFGHTGAGDLTGWFSHWFDTTVGGKLESESYRHIAASLGVPASAILFLSDHSGEVAAAQQAGWHAWRIARADSPPPAAPVAGQVTLGGFAGIDVVLTP
ncbi:acireductone synthase [Andreprevotia chitinilytica]|uniref:acireductone synthase n=1 Tax=Andreprevotia chitinilytica TaxID=396808 RepID=UPI00068C3946|nr:acireductone synthase [Andreprevotia chitinilytica]